MPSRHYNSQHSATSTPSTLFHHPPPPPPTTTASYFQPSSPKIVAIQTPIRIPNHHPIQPSPSCLRTPSQLNPSTEHNPG
ncbi:hypothetical protein VTJ04DRAFT_9607 [Mycothermus thermophilus]|uniref:uncharacterized protein n=1 Tax=Humicola insolens TaxID=85995 RepID=UPI0037428CA2